MLRRNRQESGNITLFGVLVLAGIILPVVMILYDFGWYILDKQRLQTVVEGAGLVAANDLSRIIINDPNFGFVSLSNHPPTGRATLAPDGNPLPVTGINTLVGTVRQNSLIAREIENGTISALVNADRFYLDSTINELNWTLADCLSGNTQEDANGAPVCPVEDVTSFLEDTLPANMTLQSVTLSSGWLTSGGTTVTDAPKPLKLARIQGQDINQEGKYKAFVDIPVGRQSFSLAGLGAASTLVDPKTFQASDDEHICSIVRLECTVVRKDPLVMPFGLSFGTKLQSIVCCQPYDQPDFATKGGMILRFSGAPPREMQSWHDLLDSDTFRDSRVSTYDIAGGDYPVDLSARMRQSQLDEQIDTAQLFAQHLYHWLRNGHVRPRIDAVLGMISEPFQSQASQVYVYEFQDDGWISRVAEGGRFPTGVIADSQFSAVADTTIHNGMAPVIVFRNNVKSLGTRYGGKHCGQPLAGYPLTYMELQQYESDRQLAVRYGCRHLYNRGLALDIEIGGIRQSTASNDVESMRSRLKFRKI